jgi:hypothetical protein
MNSEQPKPDWRVGEMLYWGSARLDWTLPDRRALWVIQLADAATGRLFARIMESNCGASNLCVLRAYILTYGLPGAVTTNLTNLFVFKGAGSSSGGPKSPTRIEQALGDLKIELRRMSNHLYRVPPGVLRTSILTQLGVALRDIQATTIEEANRYLVEQYLPAIQPTIAGETEDAHRPRPSLRTLDALKFPTFWRRVRKDMGFSFRHKSYRLMLADPSADLAGRDLQILVRESGAFSARLAGRAVKYQAVTQVVSPPHRTPRPRKSSPASPRQRAWMHGFFQRPNWLV